MINKTLVLIFLSVLCFLASSCARLKFQASRESDRPIYFNAHKDDLVEVQKNFTAHFYLWGIYPKKQVVYIDEVLKGTGSTSVSNLSISLRRNIMSYILTMATLGFYYPVNGEVSVYAPKKTQKYTLEHDPEIVE